MAQLPPKPKLPTDFSLPLHHPSWIDDFLHFSSSHRRSMSDSITFLDPPMVEDCGHSPCDFQRFDDDQLLAMFDDGGGVVSCSNPSSPSDHPNLPQAQQTKSEPEEEEDWCKSDGTNGSGENTADPKRIKRILANRQSAQRSRVRKLHYISELERSVSSLQAEVAVLSPRVAFLDHQRLLLNVDNSVLKQRIAALAQDKLFKDAHEEALKREIERLSQVFYQQNLKKMDNTEKVGNTNYSVEKEQLAVN